MGRERMLKITLSCGRRGLKNSLVNAQHDVRSLLIRKHLSCFRRKNATVCLEEANTALPKYYSGAIMNHPNDLIPALQIE